MYKPFFIVLLIFICVGCSTDSAKEEPIAENALIEDYKTAPEGKIEFNVELVNDDLKVGDDVILNVEIKNNDVLPIKLLFDKPETAMGPWATSAQVFDSNTGKSVLKYENKAMLSSQLYSEDDLKHLYYMLEPKGTLNKNYSLSEIVVFDNTEQKLKKGSYNIQLFYYQHKSNVLEINIK